MSVREIPRYHQLLDFMSCRKKYWWAWVKNLEPKVEAQALTVGRVIHSALARSFISLKPEELNEEELAHLDKPELVQATLSVASERVLNEYREIVAVEKPVVLDFLEVRLRGTVDLLAKRDGELRVVDYKTYSVNLDSFYEQGMINGQLHFYCLAVEQMTGERVSGYDIVAIQKARSKSSLPSTTILSFPLEQAQKELFEEELRSVLIELEQTHLDDGPWHRNTSQCGAHFGTCPFLDLCVFGDGALDNYRIKDKGGE